VYLDEQCQPVGSNHVALPQQMTCITGDVLGALPDLFLAAHSGDTFRYLAVDDFFSLVAVAHTPITFVCACFVFAQSQAGSRQA
jgi:hypothetical protein